MDIVQVAERLGVVAVIINLIIAVVMLVFIFMFYKMWKGLNN